MSPWRLTSMVSVVRSTRGQLHSRDGNMSKRALHTCGFFMSYLGYTVSLLTNVLSQNGYFLELTCGYCDGEATVS